MRPPFTFAFRLIYFFAAFFAVFLADFFAAAFLVAIGPFSLGSDDDSATHTLQLTKV
jgi:hypothetical protein